MTVDTVMTDANLGNGAKLFIRDQIMQRIGQEQMTIVDLGCGDGRQWSWLEPHADTVKLVGIEPSAQMVENARLAFPMWEFHAGAAYDLDPVSASVATSMSVLEHVYRRDKFMHYARSCLTAGGIFYLNYDNGHFLDGNERLKNLVGPILARFGIERWYQTPVSQAEALHLIDTSGFRVVREINFHQAAGKGFFRAINKFDSLSDEERTRLARLYIAFETEVQEVVQRHPEIMEQLNSNTIQSSKMFVLEAV